MFLFRGLRLHLKQIKFAENVPEGNFCRQWLILNAGLRTFVLKGRGTIFGKGSHPDAI